MILHNFDDWCRIVRNSQYYNLDIKLALNLSASQPAGYMTTPTDSVGVRAILAYTRKLLSVDEVFTIPGKWYLLWCGYSHHMRDPDTLMLTKNRTQLIRYATIV
jgi:hypothetical protein